MGEGKPHAPDLSGYKRIRIRSLRALVALAFPIIGMLVIIFAVIYVGPSRYLEHLFFSAKFLIKQLAMFVAVTFWILTISPAAFRSLAAPPLFIDKKKRILREKQGAFEVGHVTHKSFFVFDTSYRVEFGEEVFVINSRFMEKPIPPTVLKNSQAGQA